MGRVYHTNEYTNLKHTAVSTQLEIKILESVMLVCEYG